MSVQGLANDVSSNIVDFILEDGQSTTNPLESARPATRLSPLSQTCKKMNSICERHLFRQYRLSLSLTMGDEIPHLPEPGSLPHALEKADYIQELTISHDDDTTIPEGYDTQIQYLLSTLMRSSTKLVSLTLDRTVPRLEPAFWRVLSHRALTRLEINGWESVTEFDLPESILVEKFALCYHPNTVRLLDVVHARSIYLKYPDIRPRVDLPFKPADACLREIYVDMTPGPTTFEATLDFSLVPQARIHVEIPLPSDSNETTSDVIRNWLPNTFAENLTGFNVFRKFDTCFMISRPSLSSYPNWEPMFQDHLDDGVRDPEGIYSHWENKISC